MLLSRTGQKEDQKAGLNMTDPSRDKQEPQPSQDYRVYVPQNDGWEAFVKPNSVKEYCYFKAPGEEHFHLLMTGEIYLQKGHEKCCLNCAIRQNFATLERMHWQHPPKRKRPPSQEV